MSKRLVDLQSSKSRETMGPPNLHDYLPLRKSKTGSTLLTETRVLSSNGRFARPSVLSATSYKSWTHRFPVYILEYRPQMADTYTASQETVLLKMP